LSSEKDVNVLRFCGYEIELAVESVVQHDEDLPAVCSAVDGEGHRYLIVEAADRDGSPCWVCAPATDRAVAMVAEGRAAAYDAVLHSATGWVDVVRLVDGHAVPDQRVLCSHLASALVGA
jgi:hypothetical protein